MRTSSYNDTHLKQFELLGWLAKLAVEFGSNCLPPASQANLLQELHIS